MNTQESEFAILEVAFLMTALDGHIDDSERAMFEKLSEQCKWIDVEKSKEVLEKIGCATNRLLKAKKGKTDAEFISVFMREVGRICDWKQFVRDSSNVRRAFIMWTAMAMSDNDFADIERMALAALAQKMNSYPVIEDDFLVGVEDEIGKIRRLEDQLVHANSIEESRKKRRQYETHVATLEAMVKA